MAAAAYAAGADLQRNAELVLALAGGDLGVGLRVDVGVHADAHRRLAAELAGHVVDAGQLGLALGMQRENPRLEREPDLRLGLAHAGENAAIDLRARRQHAAQFAAADEIEGGAQVRKQAQQREVGIGLQRIAHLHVHAFEAAGEAAVVVLDGGGAVDVGGSAVEPGHRGEIDGLAVEGVADVVKAVHGGGLVKVR